MAVLAFVADERGTTPLAEFLEWLKGQMCQMDGCSIEELTLRCVNGSVELAEELRGLDSGGRDSWDRVMFVLIPSEGEIVGYLPRRRLLGDFVARSGEGRSSYEVFRELLLI